MKLAIAFSSNLPLIVYRAEACDTVICRSTVLLRSVTAYLVYARTFRFARPTRYQQYPGFQETQCLYQINSNLPICKLRFVCPMATARSMRTLIYTPKSRILMAFRAASQLHQGCGQKPIRTLPSSCKNKRLKDLWSELRGYIG